MKSKIMRSLTYLSLLAITQSAIANDYVFKISESFEEEWSTNVIESGWSNLGQEYNCSTWSPAQNTFNATDSKVQTKSCSQDQTQTVITTVSEAFSGTSSQESVVENQTVSVPYQQTVNGTRHAFKIKSCGLHGCSRTEGVITYDGVKYQANRSWGLLVVHPTTKKAISYNKYDVYGSVSQAEAMRDKLNSIPNGYIAIINTWDEPSNNSDKFTSVLASNFGASRTTFGSRSSYYLASYKNGLKITEDYKAGETNSISSPVMYLYE